MKSMLMVLGFIFVTISPTWGQTTGANEENRRGSGANTDRTAELEIRSILDQDVHSALSLELASAESQIAHFEHNYASDYISVGANGTVYTLGDILSEIRENGPNNQKLSSVEMSDRHVRIHGETAVATYIMTYSWQSEDGPSSRSIRESAVFVKRDGRWLRILEQRSSLTNDQ